MAGPGEKPLPESQEPFLSRWSRLKDEARQAPADPAPVKATEEPGPAPALPSLDEITPETDFRPFFHPKVGEEVRRAALKKLFSDPHFNVMDGLDVYIDDYSKTEPIPEAMMQGLRQAQMILASAREDAEERERKKRAQAAPPQSLEAPVAAPGAEAGTPADMERPVTDPAGVAGGAGDGTKA
jgi:hypothetical protein